MSTIHDLRAALDREAATVDDMSGDGTGVTATDRVSAVRGRARVVRRRRAAGGVLAVVLVVGAVATVPILGGGGQEAPVVDRQLGGLEAPASLTSLGATYDFVEGGAGERELVVQVQAQETPRLLTWGSAQGPLRIRSNVAEAAAERVSTPGDFSDFTLIEPGAEEEISVRGRGEVAWAIYELTDPAAGQAVDGMVWPDVRGDLSRVASVIAPDGGPARTEVPDSLEATGLEVQSFCHGDRGGDYVQVEAVDESAVSWSACGREVERGAIRGNAMSWDRPRLVAGTPIESWLVRASDVDDLGPRERIEDLPRVGTASGVSHGVAVYEETVAPIRVAGWSAPQVVEHDGHRWGLTDRIEGDPATATLDAQGAPLLAAAYATARGRRVLVEVLRDGRVSTDLGLQGGGVVDVAATSYGPPVEVALRVRGDGRARMALVVYQRLG